jgi:MerR family mercuric resistance operon transcriptional regulator
VRKPGSRYRQYSTDTLRTIRFIRRAQALGFTLDEIRDLLGL